MLSPPYSTEPGCLLSLPSLQPSFPDSGCEKISPPGRGSPRRFHCVGRVRKVSGPAVHCAANTKIYHIIAFIKTFTQRIFLIAQAQTANCGISGIYSNFFIKICSRNICNLLINIKIFSTLYRYFHPVKTVLALSHHPIFFPSDPNKYLYYFPTISEQPS